MSNGTTAGATTEARGSFPHWRRNLYAACAGQFVLMAAIQLLMPFLALFIHEDLGIQDMRRVELWAGAIQSASMLMAALMSPVWGALADRHGRKVMVLRAAAAVGVFSMLAALVRNVHQLLAVRLLMGLFSGFGAAAVALVGAGTPPHLLGYALGILSTGQLAGIVFGPLLGGVLAAAIGYRGTFLITGLLSLGACLLMAVLVREHFVPVAREQAEPLRAQMRGVAAVPGLLAVFGVLLMAQVANSSAGPQLSLFVLELTGDPDRAATLAGIAFAAAGLGSALAAPLLGRRADALGCKPTLTLAMAGAVLLVLPQALVSEVWQLAALRFGLGMFVGGILPTANALVGHLTPRRRRATAYGLTSSATFMGNFLGPVLGAVVVATFGLRAIFLFTGLLMLANLLWVSIAVREPARTLPDGQAPREPHISDTH
ncbi:MAG: MFS transporter [Bacillota bacterium]